MQQGQGNWNRDQGGTQASVALRVRTQELDLNLASHLLAM